MAKLNKANLKTKINERFPDNNTRYITAAILRSMSVDFVDSFTNDLEIGVFLDIAADLYDVNLNTLTKNGIYFIYGDEINTPLGADTNGYLQVFSFNDHVCLQLYSHWSKNLIYVRRNVNGTWTSWTNYGFSFVNTWNTTDELPTGNQFDEWYVPSGGWTYDGNYFEAWKHI